MSCFVDRCFMWQKPRGCRDQRVVTAPPRTQARNYRPHLARNTLQNWLEEYHAGGGGGGGGGGGEGNEPFRGAR